MKKERRLSGKRSAVPSVTSGGSRYAFYGTDLINDALASLSPSLPGILEIENDSAADVHSFLEDATEVCAKEVDLSAPRDVRSPLDVNASAAHEAPGVETGRADALIEAVMCAAEQNMSPRLILSFTLSNFKAAAVKHDLFADGWAKPAKCRGDSTLDANWTVSDPAIDAGLNAVQIRVALAHVETLIGEIRAYLPGIAFAGTHAGRRRRGRIGRNGRCGVVVLGGCCASKTEHRHGYQNELSHHQFLLKA